MPKRHPSLLALSHDHHHGLALALRCRKQALGQIKPLGAQGLRQRAEEFLNLFVTELDSHFRAEEEILFAEMRMRVPESRQLIDDLMRDHETIRRAVPRLEGGSELGKLIFDLGDLLERHIRREERELFSLFEQHAAEVDAAKIGVEMSEIFAQRSTQKVSSP
jgi:iron-sulfur cluster repair protein YtfE (RIC family)